jgi:hypothetical protein
MREKRWQDAGATEKALSRKKEAKKTEFASRGG